jgi:glycosyltransferase involved in cell wall biosynthesis
VTPAELLPFVSVVMPIRNEADFIAQSLGSVLAQDYPTDRFEVLVADGRSNDRTREIVSSLAGQVPQVRVIDNPEGIVPTGFNAALRVARGDIIVRVDGHTELANDYVRQCVVELERTGAENVGGRMTAGGKGPVGNAIVLATSSPFGVGGARFHYSESEEWVDTVYLGAWRRSTFDRLGGFDEEFVRNQDDEFNYRLRAAGGRILLSPKIRSRYFSRGSWAALWRQYEQYGFWKVRVLQKHAAQMKLRQFAPPAFVVGLLLALASAPFSRLGRIAGGALVLSYLAALAWGTLRSRSGQPPSVVARLPIAFAILHVSYGLGFMAGLLRFAGRWRDRTRRTVSSPASGGNP